MVLSTQSGYISAYATWSRLRLMQWEFAVLVGSIVLQEISQLVFARVRVEKPRLQPLEPAPAPLPLLLSRLSFSLSRPP